MPLNSFRVVVVMDSLQQPPTPPDPNGESQVQVLNVGELVAGRVAVLAGMRGHAASAGVQEEGKAVFDELGREQTYGAFFASAVTKTMASRRRAVIKEARRRAPAEAGGAGAN